MKTAESLAAKMADRVMQESPMITKGSGMRKHWESVFFPVAQAIIIMEKCIDSNAQLLAKAENRFADIPDYVPSTWHN